MMSDTYMQVVQGKFQLRRFPIEKHESLQAWDAADEYLLNDVAAKIQAVESSKVLLINDSFGALAVALQACSPYSISDSFIAQQATLENLALNQLDTEQVTLLTSLEFPAETFDFILIKAPKTLTFLDYLLIRLQANLKADTQVIIAGMAKNMSPAVWQTLARLVGETTPSRAVKKARLIYASPDAERSIPDNPYPIFYALENTDYQICNHANIFSHQRLDIGTRFFLQHLPQHEKYQQVVDLGCGNGLVGLIFATQNPNAYINFIDESFMAVASAEDNFKRVFDERAASFICNDALTEFAENSVDIVLCNPPFHQQNTIGNHIAMRMFAQAKAVLRSGGELWVIGNRHLAYQANLKKYFSHVSLVASNAKFIIVRASNES